MATISCTFKTTNLTHDSSLLDKHLIHPFYKEMVDGKHFNGYHNFNKNFKKNHQHKILSVILLSFKYQSKSNGQTF